MVFHKDAPENEKLVLKRSILGLGRVMYLDVARMLEQIKSCLRYGGARFLYAFLFYSRNAERGTKTETEQIL